MRYIDRGELFNRLANVKDLGEAFGVIQGMEAAEVEEVVRCRECVMWDGSFTLNGQKKCLNMTFCTDGDFYCGWGSKE